MIRLRTLFKWLLFAAVLAFVCNHGYRLWNQGAGQTGKISLTAAGFGWLLVSALLYILSWLPSVWFWRELMRALGGSVTFDNAARAYYCGHLGKYVPGKAMVLVIRAALVKDRGCGPLIAAITAAYETLLMMGTGLAVGMALSPLLFREWLAVHAPAWIALPAPALQAVAAALVITVLGVVSLGAVSRLLTWMAAKATPGAAGSERLTIPAALIAKGCMVFVLSWGVQGLSLGLILHAAVDLPFEFSAWPLWTGAMSLSMSLGFLVLFAPAGLGVREGILLAILGAQPGVSAHTAVAVTLLSRVVSFLSEIATAAVLYLSDRGPAKPSNASPPSEAR